MAILSITEARRYVKPTQATDDQLNEMMQLVEEFVWILCEPIMNKNRKNGEKNGTI